MLENVKCGSHQKNGMSLGPENTKSDILKRTSKLARHPPPPCPHFSAFQVPPSPPLVRTSFMYGPLCVCVLFYLSRPEIEQRNTTGWLQNKKSTKLLTLRVRAEGWWSEQSWTLCTSFLVGRALWESKHDICLLWTIWLHLILCINGEGKRGVQWCLNTHL